MKELLWRVLNVVQFIYTGLWTAFWVTLAVAISTLTRRRGPALAMARRLWAPGLLIPAGVRLEVRGREQLEPGRAYYFASNHQSIMDIPTLFAALPVPLHFVAKQELATVPFLSWYMRSMGMVFIDRGNRGGVLESTEQIRQILALGGSVVSFPEGTRSEDGSLGRLKPGGFQAAIAAAATVVPVAIQGTGRVLPARGMKIRPGRVRVQVGEPLDPGPEDTRRDLADRVESALTTMLGAP